MPCTSLIGVHLVRKIRRWCEGGIECMLVAFAGEVMTSQRSHNYFMEVFSLTKYYCSTSKPAPKANEDTLERFLYYMRNI
jgi:hypothetical protein